MQDGEGSAEVECRVGRQLHSLAGLGKLAEAYVVARAGPGEQRAEPDAAGERGLHPEGEGVLRASQQPLSLHEGGGVAGVEPGVSHFRGESGVARSSLAPGRPGRRCSTASTPLALAAATLKIVRPAGLGWHEGELDEIAEPLGEDGDPHAQRSVGEVLLDPALDAEAPLRPEIGIPDREWTVEVLEEARLLEPGADRAADPRRGRREGQRRRAVGPEAAELLVLVQPAAAGEL